MTFQDFVNEHNGQGNVGDTSGNHGECVGLAEVWLDEIGAPHIWGNAIDLLANADRGAYDVTYNTPDGTLAPGSPQEGDLVVWGQSNAPDVMTSSVGHVGIWAYGDINGSFVSFDQNFPTGANCHLQKHSYHGVAGWIHPKALDPAPAPEPSVPVDATPVPETPAPTEPSQPASEPTPPVADPTSTSTPPSTPPANNSGPDEPGTPLPTQQPEPTTTPAPSQDILGVSMNKLKSRKLWMTIGTDAYVIGGAALGYFNTHQTITVVGLISALYIAVEGIVDAANRQ